TIGISLVTVSPLLFAPVARTVSGYSPGPREPPLMDRVTLCVSPLPRLNELGLMLVAPSPAGRTPLACGPPSIERDRVPLKYVPPLFGVLKDIVPVPVAPVLATAMTRPVP